MQRRIAANHPFGISEEITASIPIKKNKKKWLKFPDKETECSYLVWLSKGLGRSREKGLSGTQYLALEIFFGSKSEMCGVSIKNILSAEYGILGARAEFISLWTEWGREGPLTWDFD